MNPGKGTLERDEDDPRPFPGPGAGKFGAPYKFNADEIRALKDCNRESFYQRCLPLSALFGSGIYYSVKTGMLKGNARFGAAPKVAGGVVLGYLIGKFSYQGKCAEKLMQLPNSPVGEMLRQRRKGGFKESLDSTFGPSMSLSPFSNISPSDTYSDVGSPENSLDMDTSRPDMNGLDDTRRPSLDNPVYEGEEEMPPIQKSTTTYEELRKQNREEYQMRRVPGFRDSMDHMPHKPGGKSDPTSSLPRTNKYGDSFE